MPDALSISRDEGDRASEANALDNLGQVYQSLGQYQFAIEKYDEALEIRQEIGDQFSKAISFNNLGSVYHALGNCENGQEDYEKSWQYYKKALEIFQDPDVNGRPGEADSQNGLGAVFCSLGNYGKAITCLQEALRIRQEIGVRAGQGESLSNLGDVYSAQGQYAIAINHYTCSLKILQGIGHREFEAKALEGWGDAYCGLEEYENAVEIYKRADQIFCEIGSVNKIERIKKKQGDAEKQHSLHQADIYERQGQKYLNQQKYQEAVNYYKQVLKLRRKLGDFETKAENACNLANAYHLWGQQCHNDKKYDDAIQYLKKALRIRQVLNDQEGQAETLSCLGESLIDIEKYQFAIQIYEKLLEFRHEPADQEAKILLRIGDAYTALEENKHAVEVYRKALSISSESNDARKADIYRRLGSSYNAVGYYYFNKRDHQRAISLYQQALEFYDKLDICLHTNNDLQAEVQIHRNLRTVYSTLGEKRKHQKDSLKAISFYQQALEHSYKITDHFSSGDNLHSNDLENETQILYELDVLRYELEAPKQTQHIYWVGVNSPWQQLAQQPRLEGVKSREPSPTVESPKTNGNSLDTTQPIPSAQASEPLLTSFGWQFLRLGLLMLPLIIGGIVVAILLASLLGRLLKIDQLLPNPIVGAGVGFRSSTEKNGQSLVSQLIEKIPPPPPPSLTYQVSCLAGYQLLRVRQSPGLSASTVATLPCNVNGIKIVDQGVTSDGEIWVPIQYQISTGRVAEGWIVKRFLVEE